VYLTREEERMLNGEYGEAVRLAIRTIVKVGEALNAEKLIKVKHVHVSGISYHNIGDAGLEFIRDLARSKAKVRVLSTINPLAFDLDLKADNLDLKFVEKQLEIINYLLDMGFTPSFTCTPYVIRRPKLGEHLSWAESSAVAYVNTVFGARTNREGGPLALLSAIVGRTYYAGVHLTENRIPRILVDVKVKVRTVAEAGVVGYMVGDLCKDKIPYIRGLNYLSNTMVKNLCAALATSSDLPMCIIEGISPEFYLFNKEFIEERIIIDGNLLKEYTNRLCDKGCITSTSFTGCPHIIISDVEYLSKILTTIRERKLKCIITTNRYTYWYFNATGLSVILNGNLSIVKDTCPVVSPSLARDMMSDSPKAIYYISRIHGRKMRLYIC